MTCTGGNVPATPFFLYINGEGPVYSPPSEPDDEVVILAKKFGGLIVTLEHRYYGQSAPFKDYSTANLQYLSSSQALFDLAVFISNFVSALPPAPTPYKVFTIGGSYSGALSAWFRLKYPHITVGAIASSGVVNAILDFTAFDEQVAQSAGPECANVLRMVTQQVEQQVLAGGDAKQKVKALFHAESLTDDGDFFYFLADSMAEGVQYGFQDYECLPLLTALARNQSLLPVYANYTLHVWGMFLGTPDEYGTAYQQDTSVQEDRADRQWWYQTCTELGYFQNAPAQGSIRSRFVNMTYHKTHCANVFGMPLWPNTNATNEYYGGNNTAATNVYFNNGSQDPWQRASVRSALSPSEPAGFISCHNCGHCVDLGGCPYGCDDNNNSLQAGRARIISYVAQWVQ